MSGNLSTWTVGIVGAIAGICAIPPSKARRFCVAGCVLLLVVALVLQLNSMANRHSAQTPEAGQQGQAAPAGTPASVTPSSSAASASPSPEAPSPAAPPQAPPQAPSPTWYDVTLLTLQGGGDDSNKQVVVGSRLFTFDWSADSGWSGGGFSGTTCRSITVTAGIPDKYTANSAILSVLTTGARGDVNVPAHQLATKRVALPQDGGFRFAVAINGDGGLYWNAVLSCSTPTGH